MSNDHAAPDPPSRSPDPPSRSPDREAERRHDHLRRLLAAIGPSSFEHEIAAVVTEIAAEFATVGHTPDGSLRAVVRPGGEPRIALVAHIDEVGLIVKHVDDGGRLWPGPIGIVDPSVVVGQRVVVRGAAGPIPGVVGHDSPHFGVSDRARTFEELWIDIGADDAAHALAHVAPGDPVVLDAAPIALLGDRLTARALDNRLGVLVALEAARAAASSATSTAEITVLATTREETTCGGAAAAGTSAAPDLALVVDCTFASDLPLAGLERRIGHRPLGSGPSIARGGPHSDRIASRLIALAREDGVPYTIEAEGDRHGTDADVLHAVAGGTPCGGIGIPLRHLHSPAETADLRDVHHAITLATRFCLTPS